MVSEVNTDSHRGTRQYNTVLHSALGCCAKGQKAESGLQQQQQQQQQGSKAARQRETNDMRRITRPMVVKGRAMLAWPGKRDGILGIKSKG